MDEKIKDTPVALPDGLYAIIDTDRGEIILKLEFEKTPLTVTNFVGLAQGTIKTSKKEGVGFYDGLTFHRVIDNFMIQGGDPLGNGTGGPRYQFPDEFELTLNHSVPGMLSMANSGPDTNGSQFFITHIATPWLDNKHTVFGQVVTGQEVVNAIQQGDKIKHIRIERIGEKAKAFKADQEVFNKLLTEADKQEKEGQIDKKEAAIDFIKKEWPQAISTPSGLMYIVLNKGSGKESPVMGTTVTVHYEGFLLDRTKFDSSIDRGSPAQFSVGQVIQGWNEALMHMKRGEKRFLIIPPELAYGEKGYPGVIPPESYLIFEVELIDF